MSEDPTFWSKQNLTDPQSMNSYSYANDNPIVKSDPSGRCVWDGCALEIVALGAFAGGVGGGIGQLVSDIGRGQASSFSDYAASVGKGAFVGGTVAGAGILGAGAAITGVVAGLAYGGSTVAVNDVRGIKNNWKDIAIDSAITGVTGGILEGILPGVPGRNPNLFTDAFFTGSHMTNALSQNIIDLGAHSFGSAFSGSLNLMNSYVVKNNTTYMQTSGGGSQQTSLPATISQGGATYYRNSSGLLSSSPGK